MSTRLPLLALIGLLMLAATVEAGYPILSRFTRTANGPYQPQVRRYIVVDPVDAAAATTGQVAAGAAHHQPLWVRRDAAVPVYPYGWFGARAATNGYSHTGYYEDYVDRNSLRGR